MSNWLVTEWGWGFWVMVASGPANLAFFFVGLPVLRWINLAVGIFIIALVILSQGVSVMAGCYPWSPKTVSFHQNMTICPGQSAIGNIIVRRE